VELSVLHTAFFLAPHGGILRQMEAEQEAADALGVRWQCGVFTAKPASSLVAVNKHTVYKNRFTARLSYYSWLLKELKKADVLILRHSLSDPLQLPFMLLTRKPIVLMHHTLELGQVKSYAGKFQFAKSKLLIERIFGYLCLRQADAIVGVTSEIVRHELERIAPATKPTHVYPNGIGNKALEREIPEIRTAEKTVRILFVASLFIDWHGLDKVMEAVCASNAEFILDIAGLVDDDQLLSAMEADTRVHYHGEVDGKTLQTLMANATVGLGSFALERKEMFEACPLKVRDYLSVGLPVYSGHQDIFPDDFPFYKQGPCDIDSLMLFVLSVEHADRSQVITAALPYVGKQQLLNSLHAFIEKTVLYHSV